MANAKDSDASGLELRARARYLAILVLSAAGAIACAGEGPAAPAAPPCDTEAVVAHVIRQFLTYGPRSQKREYFGFIFRQEGEINSAVVAGRPCREHPCIVNTAKAAERIPSGAKVLGEWHTHPHNIGSRSLSMEDVRGANHNVHIRCYTAYYAGPDGQIFSWDPRSTSVPTAMRTRVQLGSYSRDALHHRW